MKFQQTGTADAMISANLRDLAAGILIASVGGAFHLAARGLPDGAPGQIGPGFVPSAIGLITVGLGLLIAVRSLGTVGAFPRIEARPVLSILAAVATFGLLVKSFGLVPALVGTTVIAALGSGKSRPRTVAALAVAVAVGCWLVFIVALGLPVQAIRNPF